jgi:hypothetical protein
MQNSKDTRVLTVPIATAVLAAVATPISLANTQEAEALMREGDLKVDAGAPEATRLFYLNAIKKDPHPKLPAGFVNRGNCYRGKTTVKLSKSTIMQ